jgi:hypothetical protein
MSETQTILNCFYCHTIIITMMSKHLLLLVNQSLVPEKYNNQQGRGQGTLPSSNSFYTTLDFQSN